MKRYQLWFFLRLQLNYLWVVHFQLLVAAVLAAVVVVVIKFREVQAEES
jgi:hypothetical protein